MINILVGYILGAALLRLGYLVYILTSTNDVDNDMKAVELNVFNAIKKFLKGE